MSSSSTTAQVPLWLDCDPGHDDAFAMLLAVHHPSLKLLGISTVHGNTTLENTAHNAGSILEAIGRSDIPVYPGLRKPFSRYAIHAPDIHGVSGLDGTDLLPAPTRPPVKEPSAVFAMRDALMSQPKDTAWVVATGTLTNVGVLFAAFPEVAEHVRGVSIMGGAFGGGFTDVSMSRIKGEESRVGNITPWAEFNVYCDPESARSILSSPVLAPKTTLIPLDITHQVLASETVQSRILHGGNQDLAPTVLRQILHALLNFFAHTYDTVFGLSTGPPLHDPIAVAVLLSNLNPSATKENGLGALRFDDRGGERFAVGVVTDGEHSLDPAIVGQLGRTIAKPVQDAVVGGTIIPRTVDIDAFWDMIVDCIQRADDWNASRKV